MMTAYFVPDDCFQQMLLDAVARGVQVDVMLPGPHADKRVCQLASESIYATLADGGDVVLTGVLVRPGSRSRVADERPGVALATTATELLALGVDLVAECGGHAALREHAEALLRGELRRGDVVLFKSSRDAGLRLLGDRLATTTEEQQT